ncbi:nitroreductase family protein [Yinghuangia seranimata]|uniref:nitroreductase family protein n=1 Tax=Yinghuangia seranimata TaxID=408067 RepID=UPI00248BD5BC|nr:nitroreductase family protein [Yinghuangia seranimata]MDI2125596.1 nitroreductase family protein [Yinghuangia seranimata]
MEFSDVVRTTGAVRRFTDEPVPDATLARVFDNARFAPSGGNRQGWHVVIARSADVRRRLSELSRAGWEEYQAYVDAGRVPFAPGEDGRMHGVPDDVDFTRPAPRNRFIEQLERAPVLAVLAVDLRQLAVTDRDQPRHSIVGGGSVYPFAQNVLLSARDAGLGGVLTTFLCRREPEVKELLGLPQPYAVAALLAIGVPERHPRKLTRRKVEEFVTFDRFDGAPLPGPDAAAPTD